MSAQASQLNYSIETKDLNLWYGNFQALKERQYPHSPGPDYGFDRPLRLRKDNLAAMFNRINERYGYVKTTGEINVLGQNIYAPGVSLIELRKAVGMVFQRPNPLPISVRENVVFGCESTVVSEAFGSPSWTRRSKKP